MRRLSGLVEATAVAGFALLLLAPAQALAEFEIQESGVEKGEVELEYRGATHSGFPGTEREEASGVEEEGGGATEDEDEEVGALEEEEEGEFLRQSHDFEVQYGITERILLSTTLGTDEPLDGDFDLSSVELEAQYELIQREGNGIGLAFTAGYGFATRGGEADEIEFGPIVELASNKLLLTFNPFFGAQVGEHRETDSLGFEYGWRAEYGIAKRWGVGLEMFGEIEDLSDAGSFDDQAHSIGPTLFFNPGGEEEEDDEEEEVAGPAEMEVSLNVGVQFGLTDATSDTAVKFQGSLGF